MNSMTTATGSIVKANAADLAYIETWLSDEYDRNHEGFFYSLDLIHAGLLRGELYVSREDGAAVAFQLGRFKPDIICVREEHRRRGHGSKLFTALKKRAERNNIYCFAGECRPEVSLGFWKKLGFRQWYPVGRSRLQILYLLGEERVLDAGLEIVEVLIEFLPADALYHASKKPLQSHRLKGALENGQITLERRVFGVQEDLMMGMVVRVAVNGVEQCFCKVISRKASEMGVREHDQTVASCDRIRLVTQ